MVLGPKHVGAFFNVLICKFYKYYICQVTQLLYQLLHIYKIYKIYTLKHSNIKNAPTCFGPRNIIRELYRSCQSAATQRNTLGNTTQNNTACCHNTQLE